MKDITTYPSNIDSEGEELRLEFNNFLCTIIADAYKNI